MNIYMRFKKQKTKKPKESHYMMDSNGDHSCYKKKKTNKQTTEITWSTLKTAVVTMIECGVG